MNSNLDVFGNAKNLIKLILTLVAQLQEAMPTVDSVVLFLCFHVVLLKNQSQEATIGTSQLMEKSS